MTVAAGQPASVATAQGVVADDAATVRQATVGIIVNPLAGTDVRRLVSGAAPMPDMHKVGILRRAVIGAIEGGATRIVLTDDRRALAHRALERLNRERSPRLRRREHLGVVRTAARTTVRHPPQHRARRSGAARPSRPGGDRARR